MPELTEISKHIMFEETSQGLNLEIVDQDGRAMFVDGSKVPYERTRRLIQKLADPLKATQLRILNVGHSAAGSVPAPLDYRPSVSSQTAPKHRLTDWFKWRFPS